MPSSTLSRRALVPFAVALGLVAVLLLLPVPGSLSVVGTRWLADLGAGLPHVELVSEAGLVALAAATAGAMLFVVLRRPERRLPVVIAALGVVVAYAASEGAKLLFAEPRPCTRWPSAGECPPAGDWSLPSNHATLAFGAVVVIAVALGRAWVVWAALALASLVAVGRVVQGVHYVHDVALGAAFGVIITGALALAAGAVAARRARPAPTS
ncbi:phosphatase PAP2 family protein [Microbacterium sp. BLY]|uniref:phosphatase PAP2 family protein n=1 Tax=Microbacterium sp. BLY TaxID=2823280 RepID=UPI001B33255C|nr:phosphatase PAP2 family protein [Microbacterium sp. BLY]MBP3976716.1 phosphatase PAP2 family protein [Microbacterium sp. BLY]